jgi:hypothetical protein
VRTNRVDVCVLRGAAVTAGVEGNCVWPQSMNRLNTMAQSEISRLSLFDFSKMTLARIMSYLRRFESMRCSVLVDSTIFALFIERKYRCPWLQFDAMLPLLPRSATCIALNPLVRQARILYLSPNSKSQVKRNATSRISLPQSPSHALFLLAHFVSSRIIGCHLISSTPFWHAV